MRRRVVITGLEWVTPLGADIEQAWRRMTEGHSAIGPITTFDASSFPVKIAAEVRDWDISDAGEDPQKWRNHPRQTRFTISAAKKAFQSAGLEEGSFEATRFGVTLGCGETYPDFSWFGRLMAQTLGNGEFSYERFVSESLQNGHLGSEVPWEPNLPAHYVSAILNAQGPSVNYTAACVSSAQAVGEATGVIRRGEADLMLAGGAHSMIHPFGLTGFHRLSVLSTRNDPTASRPFDLDRDGFVIGEGAGTVVLEDLEHAQRRGATIWGEVTGYGSAQNAFRITDSHPEGRGISDCVEQALKESRLNRDEIDYVNAHGTGTIENDRVETLGLKHVFGQQAYRIPMSSTKSMIGHLTTGCGGIDVIVCLLSIRDGVVHPTINYETPDPDCDLDYCPNTAREVDCRNVLSTSFGFGGQNAALIISRF
ncbi:MAG: beta-ketoacyl-[acyl-carrier-protein] synthase family protein [Planctomycetes bacterium]|nr:beta-ketoacyl-[acyl-carrier-protein] synthase family protein [Planctomycetota bacterium]